MCANYKLTESGNGYEFPELPSGGQRKDTVPTADAGPFVLAVPFLWLFVVTKGQKLKLASECNVCASFTTVHSPRQMGPSQAHGILNPFLVVCITLFFDRNSEYMSGYTSTEMLQI